MYVCTSTILTFYIRRPATPHAFYSTTMSVQHDMHMHEIHFFCGTQNSPLRFAGLLSRSRLSGTQGGRVYTTVHMRAPAEVRGACSRPSKSRILASNYGEAFRSTEAKQENGSPTTLKILLCCWLLAAAVPCLITPCSSSLQ